MKSISITACLLGAALAVPTADKAAFSPEMYESGEVMQQIMEAKEVSSEDNRDIPQKLISPARLGRLGSQGPVQIRKLSGDKGESYL
jgi:hypothetical protein